MHKIFKGKITTLTPIRIIQFGEIIQTSHWLIIKVRKIKFEAIHQDFITLEKLSEQ